MEGIQRCVLCNATSTDYYPGRFTEFLRDPRYHDPVCPSCWKVISDTLNEYGTPETVGEALAGDYERGTEGTWPPQDASVRSNAGLLEGIQDEESDKNPD